MLGEDLVVDTEGVCVTQLVSDLVTIQLADSVLLLLSQVVWRDLSFQVLVDLAHLVTEDDCSINIVVLADYSHLKLNFPDLMSKNQRRKKSSDRLSGQQDIRQWAEDRRKETPMERAQRIHNEFADAFDRKIFRRRSEPESNRIVPISIPKRNKNKNTNIKENTKKNTKNTKKNVVPIDVDKDIITIPDDSEIIDVESSSKENTLVEQVAKDNIQIEELLIPTQSMESSSESLESSLESSAESLSPEREESRQEHRQEQVFQPVPPDAVNNQTDLVQQPIQPFYFGPDPQSQSQIDYSESFSQRYPYSQDFSGINPNPFI